VIYLAKYTLLWWPIPERAPASRRTCLAGRLPRDF